MYLGIFYGKKLTYRVYTRGSPGYSIIVMDVPIRHHGGVAVFRRPAPHFAMEAVQQFGPNVVVFQLATGGRRCYIVGCYIAPDDTSTIESVIAALKERPRGAELLVVRAFNVNLSDQEGDQREENMAAEMAKEGLFDITAHFLPLQRSCCRYGRTWSMIREGMEVRSRTDHILGTDHHLFGNVSVRDPRHNSDHYMVLCCLHSASLREHTRYLRGRKRPPPLPTDRPV